MKRHFASDTYSGFNAEIIEELQKVNAEYDYCYGSDDATKQVETEFKKLFNCDCDIYLVPNGTGANVCSMQMANINAISSFFCSKDCHIITMETGAITRVTGMCPIVVKTNDGKIDIEDMERLCKLYIDDVHSPQPKILTIAQVSETGSVYTYKELMEISKLCKKYKIFLHIDGARFSNALIKMQMSPADFIKDIQPDILVFGGTKNGLMFGEAICVFNKEISKNALFVRKQTLSLLSKMKYLSCQFLPYLKKNLWYSNAKNANEIAFYLKEQLKTITYDKIGSKERKIEIIGANDANIIFAKLPTRIVKPLQEYMHFYTYGEFDDLTMCRFVGNFDSTKGDVDDFVGKIKELLVDI
ncbi:MAG: low specificity L-threonine aldolase [Rickettsiales bacterium]|nr:MAG: low specificity L-threonine aldolase [Rickettsiales bacterium]